MTKGSNKKTTNNQSSWIRYKGVEWIFMNLPFVFFLALLGLIYIFNAHSVERKMRKIDVLKAEVNDARWRYRDVQKELDYGTTQSQIQKRVANLQLKPVEEAPIKIKSKAE